MKNRIYLLILLIFFIVPCQVLALPAPANLRSIPIKKIGTVPLGTGASGSQGIEVTDKYIVINESRPSDSTATTTAVQVVNKDTLSVYKTIIADDLGHGNDVIYNSATNELYLLNGNNPTYRVYDSNTLTFKSNVKVPDLVSISSIAYDSAKDRFYLGQYWQALCYVKDSEFDTKLTFDIAVPTGYESQSFEFYDNNLYYTLINIPTSDNGYHYTPGVIYVFDEEGNIVRNLTPTGMTNRHELEGIAVDEITGKVYFLYNYWDYNKNGNTGTTPIEIWTINSNVTFKLNVNGGALSSTHGDTVGQSGNYITSNGSTSVLTIAHGAELPYYGLPDYNNPSQINIVKTGYHAVSGKEWKLSSGKTFHQNKIYYAGDFCNALLDDCVVNLYVNWTPNTYTIKFDNNGGMGTMSDVSATYDVSTDLPKNTFAKSGYIFNGWNTKEDGSGTTYSNETDVMNLTATNNGTVTLYAQWELMPDAVISSDNKLIISYSDKIIGNITNNTLIDDLVSTLTFNGTLTKLDLSGNVITDRNTIQGGDTFRITNGNEIVNYKILLHGDVDQNNAVNRIDASLIAKYIIDKNNTFSGEDGALFADINLDNEVKMNDTMILLNEIG